ncbi:hypothetical protein B0J17DRAFT_458925 [Rhizoctonia solani]|nr:hypothetical protein B0J17DRAFT_458925 [Rhizoctonia solani]
MKEHGLGGRIFKTNCTNYPMSTSIIALFVEFPSFSILSFLIMKSCLIIPWTISNQSIVSFQGAQITSPPVALYVFVIEAQYKDRFSIRGTTRCNVMLSQYTFPHLSADLVAYLQNRDIIVHLAQGARDAFCPIKFFSISHLWLLYTLYLNSPSAQDTTRDKLAAELDKYQKVEHDWEALGSVRDDLGRSIEQLWAHPRQNRDVTKAFGVWAYRVVECVFQQQGLQPSDPRWRQIEKELAGVAPELRGLSSFTDVAGSSPDEIHVKIDLEEPKSTT